MKVTLKALADLTRIINSHDTGRLETWVRGARETLLREITDEKIQKEVSDIVSNMFEDLHHRLKANFGLETLWDGEECVPTECEDQLMSFYSEKIRFQIVHTPKIKE